MAHRQRSPFWCLYDQIKDRHPDVPYRARLQLASIQNSIYRAKKYNAKELSSRDENIIEHGIVELAGLSPSRAHFHEMVNTLSHRCNTRSLIRDTIKGNNINKSSFGGVLGSKAPTKKRSKQSPRVVIAPLHYQK